LIDAGGAFRGKEGFSNPLLTKVLQSSVILAQPVKTRFSRGFAD
jgi:hypothetical protein